MLTAVGQLTKQTDKNTAAVDGVKRQLLELRAELGSIRDMVKTTHNYILELRALQSKTHGGPRDDGAREGSCF